MSELRTILLSIIVEPNDDGFLAHCPGIQGAFAEGDTIEEAIFNCVDVVKMISAYRSERNEPLVAPEVDVTIQTRFALSMPVAVG